jgi:flagellar FliL protein
MATAEIDAPTAPSKLPLIIAAVGALLVGVGAGFGVSLVLPGDLLSGGATDDKAAAEVEKPLTIKGADGKEIVIDKPSAITMVDLGRFTVNLRGGGGGRTLRMQVQVQTRARFHHELTDQMPALRDSVLSLASDYTYHDLEGLDGKQRLRDDLQAATGRVVGTEKLERLFFTEFIVN